MMKNDFFLKKPGFVIKEPLSTGGEFGFLLSMSLSIAYVPALRSQSPIQWIYRRTGEFSGLSLLIWKQRTTSLQPGACAF
jgi:hypothetical protein